MARKSVGQYHVGQDVAMMGDVWSIDSFPSRRTAKVVRQILHCGFMVNEYRVVSLRVITILQHGKLK